MLLGEMRWLVFAALASLLAISLWGFHSTDPSWSFATEAVVRNPAGRFGATVSDLLLLVFGASAWWWVIFFLVLLVTNLRRLRASSKGREANTRPLYLTLSGFALLLVASATLETLRFYSLQFELPFLPGGILGTELGEYSSRYLGFTGATLLLVILLACGWSMMSGISWIRAAEKTGGFLESIWLYLLGVYKIRKDRRAGRQLAEERGAQVEDVRAQLEKQPAEPVHIEPVLYDIEVSPKAEERYEKEKQPNLFGELPDDKISQEDKLPELHLLDPVPHQDVAPQPESLEFTSRLIERKLADFGVKVQVISALPGPVITRYEIEPAQGVKGSQVVNLERDLARALALVAVRIVETVPGKTCMALELPNAKRQVVKLLEMVASKPYNDGKSALTVCLGKDISGHPVVADLAKMPHLLVAGTTGSGKSVGVNAMILSFLYKATPDDVRLIMIDPKMLELSIYEGIPHLLAPVVTDMKQAGSALNWCVGEMEKRYKLMSALGVRNIAGLNRRIKEAERAGQPLTNPFSLTPEHPELIASMPNIVVVIDELADLMMVVGKKVEEQIARLAQKARAAGIHLILATQRPSVDVITGLIKANIPARIAFQVSSKIDSRTILDQMGAEALLGQGDMLYLSPGSGYPVRVHGAFVSDDEVHRVVDFLKKTGEPKYIEEILSGDVSGNGEADNGGDATSAENDQLYDQAVEVVLKNRRASISLVQRHLRIGYNRSARLIEAMEKAGLVSGMDGRGTREVLAPNRET